MKKILKPVSLDLLVSFFVCGATFANGGAASIDKPGNVLIVVKATPVYKDNKNNQVAVLETDFPNVAANFSKLYSSAQSPLWFKNSKTLDVYFKNGNGSVFAAFSFNGDFKFAITDLNKNGLPPKMAEQIQYTYPSYSIEIVKEIKTKDITVYRVTLENSKGFITIQADEEGLIEIERLQKIVAPKQKQ